MNYIKKVYRLFDGFRSLKDSRAANKSIAQEDAVNTVFTMFLVGSASMQRFFKARISGGRSLQHCAISRKNAKIPGRDSAERIVAGIDPGELKELHWNVVRKAERSGVLKAARIDGHSVGIIDGIEIYHSNAKQCEEHCQVSVHKDGSESYSHKLTVLSVPCIGGSTGHLILDWTLLKSGDSTKKAEGELTGAKRLLENLPVRMSDKVCEILGGDALYANAPFVNAIRAAGRTGVLRIKGDQRILIREADAMFDHGQGESASFRGRDRKGGHWLVVAHYAKFAMPGVEDDVLIARFTEVPILADGTIDTAKDKDGKLCRETTTSYVICTDPELSIRTVWKVRRVRWDIEDSCFHELVQSYHIKHLFSHKAVEQMLTLMVLAFNMRALYLFRFRGRDFVGGGYALWDFMERLRFDLHMESFWTMLQDGT